MSFIDTGRGLLFWTVVYVMMMMCFIIVHRDKQSV